MTDDLKKNIPNCPSLSGTKISGFKSPTKNKLFGFTKRDRCVSYTRKPLMIRFKRFNAINMNHRGSSEKKKNPISLMLTISKTTSLFLRFKLFKKSPLTLKETHHPEKEPVPQKQDGFFSHSPYLDMSWNRLANHRRNETRASSGHNDMGWQQGPIP